MRVRRLGKGIISAFSVCLAIVSGANACADHALTEERQGGPLPQDPPEATDYTLRGTPVLWCDVYQVLNTVCQQCHHDPPINGAPITLLSYADTQAPLGTHFKVWEIMKSVVADNEMPYMGSAPDGGVIVPIVRPLTFDEKSTLMSWLAQGATNLGGENCPMVYDWAAGIIPPDRMLPDD
ncbi:MAG TPA: hypothetical protein VGI10_07075 [Polyangiaceae bacterium]|jgi:hypothetical protein